MVLSLTLPSSNLELSITARQLVVLIPFFFIFAICSAITRFQKDKEYAFISNVAIKDCFHLKSENLNSLWY